MILNKGYLNRQIQNKTFSVMSGKIKSLNGIRVNAKLIEVNRYRDMGIS